MLLQKICVDMCMLCPVLLQVLWAFVMNKQVIEICRPMHIGLVLVAREIHLILFWFLFACFNSEK